MSITKLCITGGSGFIGTTAVQLALDQSVQFVNFDLRPPKILKHQPFWKYVDIRDKEQFTSALEAFHPTHILHLAAMTGMDIEDMSFFDANTVGVQNLLEAQTFIKSWADTFHLKPSGLQKQLCTKIGYEFYPPISTEKAK